MNDVGSARTGAQVTRIALYCWLAVEATLALTWIDYFAGGGVNVWFAAPEVVGLMIVVETIATLLVAIVLMVWVFRAMTVARRVTPGLKTKPVWAVVSFFIPIASLWMPHVAMTEIATGSGDGAAEYDKSVRWLIDRWWAAWIARGICLVLTRYVDFNPESGRFALGAILTFGWVGTGVAAALLLQAIIGRVTRLQDNAVHGGVARVFD